MDSVYVGNLPPDIRIKDLDDFFRPFGNLVYIDVNHRANPVYALVQFENPRNAFMAVKTRHGYDFEGYTLQLRLVENEVRKRRDVSPPPPPPSFNDYSMQSNRGGFGNNYDNFNNNNRMGQNYSNPSASSSFQSSQWASFDNFNNNNNSGRSNMSQYSSNNNRMNMGQQNMLDYPSNSRSNMSYPSSSGRSNMSQQYSNSNRSNMTQQNMNYSSSRSNNMSQPNMNYSSNRSNNMPQQNMNYSNRSNDMPQQNMNYSSNRSNNMPQQNMNFPIQNQSNMMNYPNNSNWGNNNNDFGSGSYGGGDDYVYNANNNPYANAGFEDNYTHGLSGAGRKWFNRYIKDGYSPQRAREKALERRTVPYIRGEPKNNPVVSDPTNAALESIGTTIMSLLSNTPVDNFNSGNQMMSSYQNWGGDMPGPSSSNARGRGEPRNAVSKQQYLKSLTILKRLEGRGSRDPKDKLSKKYHTQIVSDYESYQKLAGGDRLKRKATTSNEGKSYTQLLVAFKKKKHQLLVAGRKMRSDKTPSGAFRKRMKILMTELNFPEIEAKALAVHPLKELSILIDMKNDYEAALKKKQEIFSAGKGTRDPKDKSSYRKDVTYLKSYEKYRVENLSSRIKNALRACIFRVHKYEKERKLPLTKTKFTRFLAGGADKKTRAPRRRRGKPVGQKRTAAAKKQGDEKDKKATVSKNAGDEKKSDEKPAEGNENKTEAKQDAEKAE